MTEATTAPGAATHTPSPQEIIFQLISGYWVTQTIATLARLGVPDLLAGGPQSASQLASRLNVSAEHLYRLMRGASSVGVLAEVGEQTFGLTPLAELLRSDVPGSMRDMAIMNGNPYHYQAWGEIAHTVRTGEGAFKHVFGNENIFELMQANLPEAQAFNGAMTNLSALGAQAVLASYDFSGIRRLCDVGGGHGFLLNAILQANPHLKGVLFDLPEVVAGAKGTSDRLETVSGSFFESVPDGCDAIIMKHILHDWDDERAIAILRHCRNALPVGGKVLVVEIVLPEGNAPHPGKLMDLNMMVMTPGGRERTPRQFQRLFEAAGLRYNRLVPTPSPYAVVEAERV